MISIDALADKILESTNSDLHGFAHNIMVFAEMYAGDTILEKEDIKELSKIISKKIEDKLLSLS